MFVFYSIPVLLPLTVYWLITGDSLDILMVFAQGMFLFALAVIPAMVNEQYEEKNNGYKFLSTLPLKKIEIVGAKFAAVFVVVAVLGAFNSLLFSLFKSTPEQLTISVNGMIIVGMVSLISTGIIYAGIAWLGYHRFVIALSIFATFMGLAAVVIKRYFHPQLSDLAPGFLVMMRSFGSSAWFLVLGVVLAVYFGLMFLAAGLTGREV